MRCRWCGNRDGACVDNNRNAKFFFVRLRGKFQSYSNVPCHIRNKIHRATGNVMTVKTEGHETYKFKLSRGVQKTRIHGSQYRKFLEDFNMEYKETIMFEFVKHEAYLSITPLDRDDVRKVVTEEEEEYDFEEHATVIVYSRGFKPTEQCIRNINMCVQDRGLGLGGVFVHEITKTDMANTGLRIPNDFLNGLGISPEGVAHLIIGEPAANEYAAYSTTKDGRMFFKSGWSKFAKKNNMSIGEVLLVMFHKIENILHISFDFI